MKSLNCRDEPYLKQLLNSSHIGVLVVDKNRKNLLANPCLCSMFGYSVDELINQSSEIFHINHQTFLNFAELALDLVLKGESIAIDYQFKHKDGSLFWVYIAGDLVQDQDEVLWTMIDITKRKESQKELISLQERMQLALDGSRDAVWDWDLITHKHYLSSQYKDILGLKQIPVKNVFSKWKHRIHPDDLRAVFNDIFNTLKKKTDYLDTSYRLKDESNNWLWIRMRGKVQFNTNGKAIRMTGTYTDVTNDVKSQLRTVQQSQIIEQIHDSVISFDLQGTITNWNLGSALLFGYTQEEVLGKHISMLFNEKESLSLEKNIETLMQKGELTTEGYLRKKSGEEVYILLSLSLFRDESGVLTHIVTYAQDISQRKKAEDALKEQHVYLQSIIDGVDDPIMVIREDYSIELMNKTLQQSMSHITIKDPKSPKCYEISHHRSTPCDEHDHPCPLKTVLHNKEHTTIIHKHYNMQGDKRYVELSATPILDKQNNCIGIIESTRDITAHLKVRSELEEQKNILDYQAHHDSLTGLPNRILFNDRLEQSIVKAKRHNTKLALMFIDLDHFKEINDSLGHAIGDEVLKEVTARLSSVIRKEDTLARLGGDEFTILLEDIHQIEDASTLAQKIIEVLSTSISINHNDLYVSNSIGISLYPDDGASAQSLLKYADTAMYKAKNEGRNNFQFYSSEMTELAFERVVMEASLRDALKHEDFIVYYQPQVDAKLGKLIGMEALVRWKHPNMGIVSPFRFIPLAETTDLIIKIDYFVMKTAITQIVLWYKQGLNPGILALNLSMKLIQKKEFIENFKSIMQETQCKPQWIELEITESQIMTNPKEALKTLNQLNEIGINLAIDDFGTGYSSLSYLKKLPINKLKIDQSFVKELPMDNHDVAITKTIISLSKNLKLKVIAEGVETKEQKEFLVEHGCNTIQGYYYAQPMPAREIERILKRDNVFNPYKKIL